MSFRIEDILRKDSDDTWNIVDRETTRKKYYQKFNIKSEEFEEVSEEEPPPPAHLNNYSILQQTLLAKVNPYYSRLNDYCTSERRFYSSVYNYDKNYFPPSSLYPDLFTTSVMTNPYYHHSQTRTKFYSSHDTVPVMFHLNSKRKGGQIRFTSTQTDALEKRFHAHKYLSPEDRRILAESLKLTDKQVKTWFQNRRAKWRRSSSNTDTECERQPENDSERTFCNHL